MLESQTGMWPAISFVKAISNELDNPILTVISTKLSPISRYQTTYEYSCLYHHIAAPLGLFNHNHFWFSGLTPNDSFHRGEQSSQRLFQDFSYLEFLFTFVPMKIDSSRRKIMSYFTFGKKRY